MDIEDPLAGNEADELEYDEEQEDMGTTNPEGVEGQ